MGRRKSSNIVKPKSKEKLATTFDCPFCTHSKCVETKLERKRALGTLYCRVCNVNYAMRISNLTEPIDIYSEWIDRCEEENCGSGEQKEEDGSSSGYGKRQEMQGEDTPPMLERSFLSKRQNRTSSEGTVEANDDSLEHYEQQEDNE